MLKKRLIPFIVMGLLFNSLAYARTSSCITGDAAYLLEKSQPYLAEITAAAKKHKVDPHLIRSVIAIESCYNKKAVSHAGAEGLMQLMPATAERFGVDDSFDSKQNVFAGARYLRYLHLRFKGDLSKILAGYNAGEGRVDRYNGVPPYKETRNYVKHVTATYKKLTALRRPELNSGYKIVLNTKATSPSKRSKPYRDPDLSLILPPDVANVIKPAVPKVKQRVTLASRYRQVKADEHRAAARRRVVNLVQAARNRALIRARAIAKNKRMQVNTRRVAANPKVVKRQPNSRNSHRLNNVPVRPWGKPGRQGINVLKKRAPHLFKRQHLIPVNRARLRESFSSTQK